VKFAAPMGLHPDQYNARRKKGGLTVPWNVEDGISIPKLKIEDRRRARVHRVHDNGVAQAAVAVPVVANERFKRRQWPGETDAVRNDDSIFAVQVLAFPVGATVKGKQHSGAAAAPPKNTPRRLHLQTRSIFIEFPRNVAFLLSPRSQLAISAGVL